MSKPQLFYRMKIILLAFALSLQVLTSCGQANKESKRALEFYSLVNNQIAMGRSDQQNFIDNLTSCLLKVRDNKNAVVDTAVLQSLFEVAKMKNLERQRNLEKIAEFDTIVNYKTVVMSYFKSYNELYKIEIPESILLFGGKSEDRFEKVSNLVLPKLKIVKEKELNLKKAQETFKSKYYLVI